MTPSRERHAHVIARQSACEMKMNLATPFQEALSHWEEELFGDPAHILDVQNQPEVGGECGRAGKEG
jgi:hypothetical protein